MKKFSFIYFTLIIAGSVIFPACKKYNDLKDDLVGNGYIHGRVFFIDNINSPGTTNFIGNISTKIAYQHSFPVNYLYSVSADVNGYFNFTNTTDSAYLIYADTTLSNIKYSGQLKLNPSGSSVDTCSLLLYPSENTQNGLVYTITDAAGSGLVNNAAICIFSIPTLANDSCLASNYNLTTNAAGKASVFNLPAQTYINVIKLQAGSILLKARDTVIIGQTGITRKTVRLH